MRVKISNEQIIEAQSVEISHDNNNELEFLLFVGNINCVYLVANIESYDPLDYGEDYHKDDKAKSIIDKIYQTGSFDLSQFPKSDKKLVYRDRIHILRGKDNV